MAKTLKQRRRSREWFALHPWKWMGQRGDLPPRDQRRWDTEPAEVLLRTWLDDDDAADLVGMLVEEPESVMNLLYDHWPTRHGPEEGE